MIEILRDGDTFFPAPLGVRAKRNSYEGLRGPNACRSRVSI
jgi:hypothetical protein